MELGNAVFGNSRGEYEVDRDLQNQFYDLMVEMGFPDGRGHDNARKWPATTGFGHTNGVFVVRPYYWGDCTCGGAENERPCDPTCLASLPNFEHVPSGFKLKWYKYPLRDSYSNRPLTAEMIEGWIAEAKR